MRPTGLAEQVSVGLAPMDVDAARIDWPRLAAVSMVAGFVLGAASHMADTVDNVVVLYSFNVGGLWVMLAFAMGWYVSRYPFYGPLTAALAGTLALLVADAAYYLSWWSVGRPTPNVVLLTALWIGPSVAVGVGLGTGGWAWKRSESWVARGLGVGVMTGLMASEALFVMRRLVHDDRIFAEVILAVVLCLAMLRGRSRILALLVTAAMPPAFEGTVDIAAAITRTARSLVL